MKNYPKFLFTAFLLLVSLLVVNTSVAAASKQLYSQAKAMWNPVASTAYYNIYYKQTGDKTYTHAVRKLSSNNTWFLITYLKRGVTYWYNVAAVDNSGKEFSWSGLKKLMSMPMLLK